MLGDQVAAAVPALRPQLEVIDVEAGYGAVPVVTGVSLGVTPGCRVVLVELSPHTPV